MDSGGLVPDGAPQERENLFHLWIKPPQPPGKVREITPLFLTRRVFVLTQILSIMHLIKFHKLN